jgi:hypothetical protein
MKQVILLAGALALGFAGPALAKPGHGNGNGHGNGHGDHAYGKHSYGKHGYASAYGYGAGGCPPGLAKKGCMPPGQTKKMFRVGQRYSTGYGTRYSYRQIPYELRNRYGLDPNDRYYYGNGYIYQVDPRTLLVQQAIAALLR